METTDVLARLADLEKRLHAAPIQPDAVYRVEEAAERMNCSQSNVYELLLTGQMALTRVGAGKAGLRVRGASITAFLDSRTEGGPRPRVVYKNIKGVG